MSSKRKTFDDSDLIEEVYAEARSMGLVMNRAIRFLMLGIKLSKSATEFDHWIVRLFKSLDGSDTHWATPKLRESPLMSDLALAIAIDHFKSPSFDAMRIYVEGLRGWEWAVAKWGEFLIAAKSLKLPQLAELAADEIGIIISSRLLKGDFGAPKIVSAGLLNLQAGKSFKLRPGRKESGDLDEVLFAFLELEQGGNCPSQAEVKSHLEARGSRIGRDRISRAFDEHDLRERASDSRQAASAAGQRRRRKA